MPRRRRGSTDGNDSASDSPASTMGRSGNAPLTDIISRDPVRTTSALAISGEVSRAFASRYDVEEEVGRGGLGVVMRARDRALHRDLAIKVLQDAGHANPGAVAEFVDEAQITGQLEHPNIVPVYDLGSDPQGRPYMAMKLVRGRTLQAILDRLRATSATSTNSDLQTDGRLEVFLKVCDAVGYAHSRGVIHRDLKPENVMVGEFGEVQVMDWGLARPIEVGAGRRVDASGRPKPRTVHSDRRASDEQLTIAGDVFGTPAYMAPEQATGDVDRVGFATDVFALGGMLYALLTCQAPYPGRARDALQKAADRDLVPPRQRAPKASIGRELDAIAMKAMAVDPDDRYESVPALQADVVAAFANRPVSACHDRWWTRLSKWARRNPGRAQAIGLSFVFSIIVAAVIVTTSMAMAKANAEATAFAVQQRVELAKEEEARIRAQQQLEDTRRATSDRRDEVREDFIRFMDSRSPGTNLNEHIATADPERLERWRLAFLRVIGMANASGEDQWDARDCFYLGLVYVALGDMGRAMLNFKQAVERDPDNTEARSNLVGAQMQMKFYDEALENASEVVRQRPDSSMAWATRGAVRAAKRDVEGALADFNKAIELNPSRPNLYVSRGQLFHDELGKPAEALEDFNRALELSPDYFDARTNRGVALTTLGRFEEAMRDLDFGLAQRPSTVMWLRLRATCNAGLGRTTEALADLNKAVGFAPQMEKLYNDRGVQHQAAGNLDAAEADFTKALELKSDYVTAWVNRARIRMQSQRYVDASHDLNQAVQLWPRNGDAWMLLAEVRYRLNQREPCLEALYQAWRYTRNAEVRRRIRSNIEMLGGTVPDDD